MSITVVISAQVSDFDLWKSKFDGLEDQRIAAGINARAYRNPDKPNTSYVIGMFCIASTRSTWNRMALNSTWDKLCNGKASKLLRAP